MSKRIEVYYNHQSDMSVSWVSGSRTFSNWLEFVDWLNQELLKGHPVLITKWDYV